MSPQLQESSSKTTALVDVRRPFLKDFPAILEISNWATCHTAANFRTEPDTLEHWVDLWKGKAETYPWFVAEIDETVIGFAMTAPFKDRCGCAQTVEVSVYIHPDHLGRRVGRTLYHHLIPALEAQGFRSVVAAIATPNPGSERLHESFGFHKVGVLSRVGFKFGKWYDLAYWQLTLRDNDDAPSCIKDLHEIRATSTGRGDV